MIKNFKPTTASLRFTTLIDRSKLWKEGPLKSLTVGNPGPVGRSRGRITVRHRSARSHRSKYRVIDFKRTEFDGIIGTVERIEYDPNRSSFIALINYGDNKFSYILAPEALKPGAKILSGEKTEVAPGNCMPLGVISVGSSVHNIELKVGGGGKLVRAAGGYAQIVGRDGDSVLLRLRSGCIVRISSLCRATVGVLSNADNQNVSIGKAGRNRWLGIRPTVRGVAMNPIDHPHGGGEGKTGTGGPPRTPWGVPTKGKKTRNRKRRNIAVSKG